MKGKPFVDSCITVQLYKVIYDGLKCCNYLKKKQQKKQRTNGPVNAHLRSAVYTNVIENSPSIGADEALVPFFFFRIINILSIQVFPFK